jgi:exodeoxyribonuclease-5
METIETSLPVEPKAPILPFEPSAEQKIALKALGTFVREDNPHKAFVLTGQAGTGKTSLIPAIMTYLQQEGTACVLCAPTGRAAQMIAAKTHSYAGTIHSLIYKPDMDVDRMVIRFNLKENPNKDYTVYIVDEGSMLSTVAEGESDLFESDTDLLSDLISFIRKGNSKNKLIIVGDPYQLPPVTSRTMFPESLDLDYLNSKHQLAAIGLELTEIHRQGADSPILKFATGIRRIMQNENAPMVYFPGQCFSHVSYWLDQYISDLTENDYRYATILASSNKMVTVYNRSVRKKLWGEYQNDEPRVGDVVVLDTNWFSSESMVPGGSTGIIDAIHEETYEQFNQFRFVQATIHFGMGIQKRVIKTLILLNSFSREDGRLSAAENKELFSRAMQKNRKFRESRFPADDPYVGSMRLRFGYALTCHKAQGGEWKRVYISPYHNITRLNWIYTAVTRASVSVFSYRIHKKAEPSRSWKTGKVHQQANSNGFKALL